MSGNHNHVGIDIRNVLRKQGNMFGDSLVPQKNTAPQFNKPGRPPSTSRATDISFEADVEREASLRAQHGRRSAQAAAYAAAGAQQQQQQALPTDFHQAASRHKLRATASPHSMLDETKAFAQRAEEAGFAMPGRRLRDPSELHGGMSGMTAAPPPARVSKMREVPAGRGLSRDGSTRGRRAGDASGSGGGAPSGAPSSSDVEGLGLMGSSMSINLSSSLNLGSSLPQGLQQFSYGQQQQGGGGGGGGGGGAPLATSWSAARAEGGAAAAGGGEGGEAAAAGAGEGPTRMTRAREWNAEVEDAYRMQEAGYKDESDAIALGHAPIERWPDGGFIRKLVTKETLNNPAKPPSQLYFPKRRECEDKDVPKVKLYQYG